MEGGEGVPYTPPTWASSPPEEYRLDVYRSNTELDPIDVSRRDHYVFGRNGELCDVEVAHPSCSRFHVVLQHGEDGVYLYDLGSTHGTFLNKERIPAKEYVRLEVGCQFQTGTSSRAYVLAAPEESSDEEGDGGAELEGDGADDAEREQRRQELRERWKRRRDRRARRAKRAQGEEEQGGGISWGLDESEVGQEEGGDGAGDDDSDTAYHEGATSLLKGMAESELPEYLRKRLEEERQQRLAVGLPDASGIREAEVAEKDREVWERAQTKRRKAENLHEEAGRIQRKREQQGGDLTEGQEKRLSRIERHIEKLTGEVQQAEDSIRAKNDQRASSAGASQAGPRRGKGMVDNDDAEEEGNLYDRVGSVQRAARPGADAQRRRFVFRGGKLQVNRSALLKARQAREEAQSAAASEEARQDVLRSLRPEGEAEGREDEPLTYESALYQREALDRELDRVGRELRVLRESAEEQELAAKVGAGSEAAAAPATADPVDDYIARSKEQVISRRRSTLETRRDILQRERDRVAAIERALKPALEGLTHKAAAPRPAVAGPGKAPEKGPPVVGAAREVEAQPAPAPAPKSLPPTAEEGGGTGHDDGATSSMAAPQQPKPAPQREAEATEEVEGAVAPTARPKAPEEAGSEAAGAGNGSTARKREASAPAKAAEAEAPAEAAPPRKRRAWLRPRPLPPPPLGHVGPPAAARGKEERTLQDGDTAWVPPSDQRGDGRTALNDKLGY